MSVNALDGTREPMYSLFLNKKTFNPVDMGSAIEFNRPSEISFKCETSAGCYWIQVNEARDKTRFKMAAKTAQYNNSVRILYRSD